MVITKNITTVTTPFHSSALELLHLDFYLYIVSFTFNICSVNGIVSRKNLLNRNILVNIWLHFQGKQCICWWLVDVPYWFKLSFLPKILGSSSPRKVKKIILRKVRFNPRVVRLILTSYSSLLDNLLCVGKIMKIECIHVRIFCRFRPGYIH